MAVIAIDLTSTELTSAVITLAGKVKLKETYPIVNIQGDSVSKLIQAQIKRLLQAYQHEPVQIKAIGISIPGICNSKTGKVWAPNIPGWEDYPLMQDVCNFLRGKTLRIKIDNKRTCSILGETWQGAAKGCKNAVFLSIGSGIGAGILIDNRILHGMCDAVGSAGWMALNKPYKAAYKEKGCFESLASGKGILLRTRELITSKKNYAGVLSKKEPEQISIKDIFEAYSCKDSIACKVVDDSIEYWGMATANLISFYNPEIVILGGAIFGPALKYLDEVRNEALKWAQPFSIDKVKFSASQLGSLAALIGAGQLAIGKH